MSNKRKTEKGRYLELRALFLRDNPHCAVMLGRGLKVPSTQVHHKAGRGKLYLRVDTWMAVSDAGHEEITNNPTWSFAMGYRLNAAQRRLLQPTA